MPNQPRRGTQFRIPQQRHAGRMISHRKCTSQSAELMKRMGHSRGALIGAGWSWGNERVTFRPARFAARPRLVID